MLADTKLLAANELIDYSLFLIQVDRTRILKKNRQQPFLMFDNESGLYKFVMQDIPPEEQ